MSPGFIDSDNFSPSENVGPCMAETFDHLFTRLTRSKFRKRFKFGVAEQGYVRRLTPETLREHAERFIRQRLAPADPPNDGKQTPMRGHPVFIAQHAIATCCRSCLAKWHQIPQGRALTEPEVTYVVDVLCAWIARQPLPPPTSDEPTLFDSP